MLRTLIIASLSTAAMAGPAPALRPLHELATGRVQHHSQTTGRHVPPRPRHRRYSWLGPTEASWYSGGARGCGFDARDAGVATLQVPCGTHIRLCRYPHGPCAWVIRDDSGPYVGSYRQFDLRPPVRDAIGCGDLCHVHWRVRPGG